MTNADRFVRKLDLTDHASRPIAKIGRAICDPQSPASDITGRVQAMRHKFRDAFAETDDRGPNRTA